MEPNEFVAALAALSGGGDNIELQRAQNCLDSYMAQPQEYARQLVCIIADQRFPCSVRSSALALIPKSLTLLTEYQLATMQPDIRDYLFRGMMSERDGQIAVLLARTLSTLKVFVDSLRSEQKEQIRQLLCQWMDSNQCDFQRAALIYAYSQRYDQTLSQICTRFLDIQSSPVLYHAALGSLVYSQSSVVVSDNQLSQQMVQRIINAATRLAAGGRPDEASLVLFQLSEAINIHPSFLSHCSWELFLAMIQFYLSQLKQAPSQVRAGALYCINRLVQRISPDSAHVQQGYDAVLALYRELPLSAIFMSCANEEWDNLADPGDDGEAFSSPDGMLAQASERLMDDMAFAFPEAAGSFLRCVPQMLDGTPNNGSLHYSLGLACSLALEGANSGGFVDEALVRVLVQKLFQYDGQSANMRARWSFINFCLRIPCDLKRTPIPLRMFNDLLGILVPYITSDPSNRVSAHAAGAISYLLGCVPQVMAMATVPSIIEPTITMIQRTQGTVYALKKALHLLSALADLHPSLITQQFRRFMQILDPLLDRYFINAQYVVDPRNPVPASLMNCIIHMGMAVGPELFQQFIPRIVPAVIEPLRRVLMTPSEQRSIQQLDVVSHCESAIRSLAVYLGPQLAPYLSDIMNALTLSVRMCIPQCVRLPKDQAKKLVASKFARWSKSPEAWPDGFCDVILCGNSFTETLDALTAVIKSVKCPQIVDVCTGVIPLVQQVFDESVVKKQFEDPVNFFVAVYTSMFPALLAQAQSITSPGLTELAESCHLAFIEQSIKQKSTNQFDNSLLIEGADAWQQVFHTTIGELGPRGLAGDPLIVRLEATGITLIENRLDQLFVATQRYMDQIYENDLILEEEDIDTCMSELITLFKEFFRLPLAYKNMRVEKLFIDNVSDWISDQVSVVLTHGLVILGHFIENYPDRTVVAQVVEKLDLCSVIPARLRVVASYAFRDDEFESILVNYLFVADRLMLSGFFCEISQLLRSLLMDDRIHLPVYDSVAAATACTILSIFLSPQNVISAVNQELARVQSPTPCSLINLLESCFNLFPLNLNYAESVHSIEYLCTMIERGIVQSLGVPTCARALVSLCFSYRRQELDANLGAKLYRIRQSLLAPEVVQAAQTIIPPQLYSILQ